MDLLERLCRSRWLNTTRQPRPADLEGLVILLDFWTYG